jgi:hypothetical protein
MEGVSETIAQWLEKVGRSDIYGLSNVRRFLRGRRDLEDMQRILLWQ